MKGLKNVLLYFSAFIPMYFLIVVKFIMGILSGTIEVNTLTIFMLIIYSVLIFIGFFGIAYNILFDKEKSEEVEIVYQKNITDQHFLGYFSIFVLFALSFELTKWSMVIVSLLIIIFIGVVYVSNKMFFINPFLNLIGFSLYEIKYTLNDDGNIHDSKLFCRGQIETNKKYSLKLKNVNFAFIDKKKN